jgi:TrpR-related protein YerC/YecD
LCTIREIQDMAQRLEVALMLDSGEHYSAIQETTGASATTISRVSKSLHYGADGYVRVLGRIGGADSSSTAE